MINWKALGLALITVGGIGGIVSGIVVLLASFPAVGLFFSFLLCVWAFYMSYNKEK